MFSWLLSTDIIGGLTPPDNITISNSKPISVIWIFLGAIAIVGVLFLIFNYIELKIKNKKDKK